VPPYNEFFTVGVSSAGNHDNNVYNQNWSERTTGSR
jgi:dipeptidyl-peptidase 4